MNITCNFVCHVYVYIYGSLIIFPFLFDLLHAGDTFFLTSSFDVVEKITSSYLTIAAVPGKIFYKIVIIL